MSRMVGTVSRGVRAPIIRSGDDLVEIVTKSVLEAAAQPEDGFAIRDRDVVAMPEASWPALRATTLPWTILPPT